MPSELWEYLSTVGGDRLALALVVYGIYVFHTTILPELKAHFLSVAAMTKAIETTANNSIEHKTELLQVKEGVNEILVRIPQRIIDTTDKRNHG